jgi:hypothetical protein
MRLPGALRRIAGLFGKLLIGFALWFGTYLGFLAWETHRVSLFCADVHPGMPISSIEGVADVHGIDRRWLQSSHSERTNDWFLYVPISSTMGEKSCTVHHDGTTVVSVRMSEYF